METTNANSKVWLVLPQPRWKGLWISSQAKETPEFIGVISTPRFLLCEGQIWAGEEKEWWRGLSPLFPRLPNFMPSPLKVCAGGKHVRWVPVI